VSEFQLPPRRVVDLIELSGQPSRLNFVRIHTVTNSTAVKPCQGVWQKLAQSLTENGSNQVQSDSTKSQDLLCSTEKRGIRLGSSVGRAED
jgi:hypothetical protein